MLGLALPLLLLLLLLLLVPLVQLSVFTVSLVV
jgi:hypothetical protein